MEKLVTPGVKTKDLTQWKFMMTSRTRYFEVEITRECWWNIVWCFYLWQCFLAINWLWNWFTVGWTCSDLSFCWEVVILKLSQKHKGPSRSSRVAHAPFLRSVKMENPVNPRCKEQCNIMLVKESFKNWLYVTVSITIQALYKHC